MKSFGMVFIMFVATVFFSSCGGVFSGNPNIATQSTEKTKNYADAEEYNKAVNSLSYSQDDKNIEVKSVLLQHYREWKHTKYKYGGASKKGIDCSAFVQNTFKTKFKIKIPRTTKLQVKKGIRISKKNLKTGDLVFFKTGFFDRHVGIYLEDGDFMHASTKKGVTISNLNSPYYTSHYWTAKRIIF